MKFLFIEINIENKYGRIINFNIKLLILIFYIFLIIKTKFIKLNNLEKEKKYKYFFCFTSIGILENKYVNELIDNYKKIGIDKFYLADNNDKNSEKLSDILKKGIIDGLVDIIDITGVKKDQT